MSKHQKRADIVAALELLCERFPKCFVLREHRRVPLKIGIRDDIIAIIGDAIDHQLLGITLQYTPTTRSIGWRRSAGRRGSISTAIRPGHRLRGRCVAAAEQVAALRARKLTPPAPVETPAPPPPPKRDGLASLRAAAQRRRAIA